MSRVVKINDDPSHPLRYIVDGEIVYGQFYDLINRTYHLAQYTPYIKLPVAYLCEYRPHIFSPSRDEYKSICRKCWDNLILSL